MQMEYTAISVNRGDLAGDRTTFDRHFDPMQIGIRSESKAFDFKMPTQTES